MGNEGKVHLCLTDFTFRTENKRENVTHTPTPKKKKRGKKIKLQKKMHDWSVWTFTGAHICTCIIVLKSAQHIHTRIVCRPTHNPNPLQEQTFSLANLSMQAHSLTYFMLNVPSLLCSCRGQQLCVSGWILVCYDVPEFKTGVAKLDRAAPGPTSAGPQLFCLSFWCNAHP